MVSGQPYTFSVTLDAMWDGLDAVVRMEWEGEGFADYPVSNGQATVEVPSDVAFVEMGVYAGRLSTTNRAEARVLPSVLDLTRDSEEADI